MNADASSISDILLFFQDNGMIALRKSTCFFEGKKLNTLQS